MKPSWLNGDDVSTVCSVTQALDFPSAFILSSPDNKELMVQFLQNHIWDYLQIDVLTAVKNINHNLKSNYSKDRQKLAASHKREPFVEDLCLEHAPTLEFWQQEELPGPQSHIKTDCKNLNLQSLTVGKPLADFFGVFSFFFFPFFHVHFFEVFCMKVLWHILGSDIVPVFFFQCNYKFLPKYAQNMFTVRTWNRLVDKHT